MKRREGRMTVRLVGAALAVAMWPAAALADHPGALWIVNDIRVSVDPGAGDAAALTAQVRQGLRQANETYFYGDQPVRMEVRVLAADAMTITLRDQLTGALLGRTGPVHLDATPAGVSDTVLAWMDGLECTASGCPGATGPVVAAVEAPATVSAPAETAAVTIAKGVAVPVPVARPSARDTVRMGRNPDTLLLDYAAPIRLSRLNTVGIGNLSYSDTDPLVTGTARALAPTSIAPTTTPTPRASTMIGRFFQDVERFFGIEETPAAAPAVAPATSAPVTTAALTNPALTREGALQLANPAPVPSFGVPQAEPTASVPSAQTQVAALSPQLESRRSLLVEPLGKGIVRMPSPGLGLPLPQSVNLEADLLVAPIRAQRERGGQTPGQPLSVRLDSNLLSSYTPDAVGRVFSAHGNSSARVRLVASPEAGPGGVDGILRARGLQLADNRYAAAHRVYWTGDSGSRGFWINLPEGAPSRFVLIASTTSSVIANVHAQGRSVQVSDAVAAALGMAPGGWSDVQVIALQQGTRTAVRRERRQRR